MKTLYFTVLLMFVVSAGYPAAGQDEQGKYKTYGQPVGVDDPASVARGEALTARFSLLARQWRSCLLKGDTAGAIAFLERSLSKEPVIMDEPRILLADIYQSKGRTDDIIRVLSPIVESSSTNYSAEGHYPTTRMKFVLALLEKGNWAEAVAIYEGSFTGDCVNVYGQATLASLKWLIPGYQGTIHTLPQKHFSVNDPDYSGLQAQAHLILGARQPEFVASDDMPKYMLGHLRQSLKYNPESLDAHFISGILLDKSGKFSEARSEFRKTARLAPDTAQAEIKVALEAVDVHEKKEKAQDEWLAAHPPAKADTPPQL